MRLRRIPGADDFVQAHEAVVQEMQNRQGAWQEMFPKRQPIHMEIGMGKGQFILTMAKNNPQNNYIGVERYASVLFKALKRFDKEVEDNQPIQNLKFLCMDAAWTTEFFNKGEVEKIYLNFSDPWPKASHAKRRLTSPEFLERFASILPPGGILEFKTDNEGLFQYSLEQIELSPWKLEAYSLDLHNDAKMVAENVLTEYEEKFSSMGHPIYKLIASTKVTI